MAMIERPRAKTRAFQGLLQQRVETQLFADDPRRLRILQVCGNSRRVGDSVVLREVSGDRRRRCYRSETQCRRAGPDVYSAPALTQGERGARPEQGGVIGTFQRARLMVRKKPVHVRHATEDDRAMIEPRKLLVPGIRIRRLELLAECSDTVEQEVLIADRDHDGHIDQIGFRRQLGAGRTSGPRNAHFRPQRPKRRPVLLA
jgi:hypothetical protein